MKILRNFTKIKKNRSKTLVPVDVFKKAMLQIFYKHEHEKWTEMNNWFRIFLYVSLMQEGRIKTFGNSQNKYAWVASIFKVNTSLFQSISLQIKQTVSTAKINLIRQQHQ